MKLLSMMLIIGAFIMGIYDGGDVTAAVVLSLLFAGSTNAKCKTQNAKWKGMRKNAKSGQRIYDCGNGIGNEF